jgi:hypothetical protein
MADQRALFCVGGVKGRREASQEQGAPEKKKQVWRLIQGCFFFFFFSNFVK